MADNPVLTINVETTDFERYTKMFEQYKTLLDETNKRWAELSERMEKASKASRGLGAWKGLERVVSGVHGYVNRITGHLLKWSTIIGSVAALLGVGGSLFGLERLSNAILDRSRIARSYGGNYGQVTAAGVYGQRLLRDPNRVMDAIRAAKLDVRSPGYRGLRTLGISEEDIRNLSVPELFQKALPAFARTARKWHQTNAGAEGTMLDPAVSGVGAIFSQEDLGRFLQPDAEAIAREVVRQIQENAPSMDISPGKQDVYTRFTIQLQAAGEQIKAIFGDKLAALMPDLTQLSQDFVDLVKSFAQSGMIDDAIKALHGWLDQLNTSIENGNFKKNLEDWGTSLKGAWDTMGTWWTAMKDFVDNIGSLSTVILGMVALYAVSRLGGKGRGGFLGPLIAGLGIDIGIKKLFPGKIGEFLGDTGGGAVAGGMMGGIWGAIIGILTGGYKYTQEHPDDPGARDQTIKRSGKYRDVPHWWGTEHIPLDEEGKDKSWWERLFGTGSSKKNLDAISDDTSKAVQNTEYIKNLLMTGGSASIGPGGTGGSGAVMAGGGTAGGARYGALSRRAMGGASAAAMKIGPIDLHDPLANPGDYGASMKVLMDSGLTEKEAAGMLGEATAESRMGTMYGGKVLGVNTGDQGTASGGFQWHSDRWNKAVAWAKSKGINPSTWSGQLKMGAHEYLTDFTRLRSGVAKATSPEEIERAMDPFEGFAGYKSGTRASGVAGTTRALDAVRKAKPSTTVKGTSGGATEELKKDVPQPIGPLSMDNWEGSRRQSTIVLRNVPGANVYHSAVGMAAVA